MVQKSNVKFEEKPIFREKYTTFDLKKYRGVHDTEVSCKKFETEIDLSFQN